MKSNNIEGFSFILQATLVSFILANNLEPAEQELLGNFLQTVGANLSYIANFTIVEEFQENSDNNSS